MNATQTGHTTTHVEKLLHDLITEALVDLTYAGKQKSPERTLDYLTMARSKIERACYHAWHEHHVSGVPYSQQVTDNWK